MILLLILLWRRRIKRLSSENKKETRIREEDATGKLRARDFAFEW